MSQPLNDPGSSVVSLLSSLNIIYGLHRSSTRCLGKTWSWDPKEGRRAVGDSAHNKMLTLQARVESRLQQTSHKYSNLILIKKRPEFNRQLFPKTEVHTNIRVHRFKTEIDKAKEQHHPRSLQKHQRNSVLLPFLDRNKSNGRIGLDLDLKKQDSSHEGTIDRDERRSEPGVKVISDFHPRINKIKLKFINRENQSCQNNKEEHVKKRRRAYQEAMQNQCKNMKINLSCQSITPLASQEVLSNKPDTRKKESKTGHMRSRYQQIPPQQFIYEHESSILTKGLVDKISKMMRKTHNKLNYFA